MQTVLCLFIVSSSGKNKKDPRFAGKTKKLKQGSARSFQCKKNNAAPPVLRASNGDQAVNGITARIWS
jgi:hypothetical protein